MDLLPPPLVKIRRLRFHCWRWSISSVTRFAKMTCDTQTNDSAKKNVAVVALSYAMQLAVVRHWVDWSFAIPVAMMALPCVQRIMFSAVALRDSQDYSVGK